MTTCAHRFTGAGLACELPEGHEGLHSVQLAPGAVGPAGVGSPVLAPVTKPRGHRRTLQCSKLALQVELDADRIVGPLGDECYIWKWHHE